jgi:hypothetical protein
MASFRGVQERELLGLAVVERAKVRVEADLGQLDTRRMRLLGSLEVLERS